MMNDRPVIGICSAGSGVGQAVINACRLSALPVSTVGLGNNELAFGIYECDRFCTIPGYYSSGYVGRLCEVCDSYGIGLLIPGHDDEALVLSRNAASFAARGVQVLASSAELIAICRRKEALRDAFPEAQDLFCKSYTGAELLGAGSVSVSYPLVAKPRSGFGSRGVSIVRSAAEVAGLDPDLIFQEIAVPARSDPRHESFCRALENGRNAQVAEVSLQLVADSHGEIKGHLATCNVLHNGVPVEIIPWRHDCIADVIERIGPQLKQYGLQGPFNIQGRLTDDGFRIFEMNPRFTGISGLRARLGFNEVKACIRHWCFGEAMEPLAVNEKLVGVRQVADKAVPVDRNSALGPMVEAMGGRSVQPSKTVLVTGSTGVLGRRLLARIGAWAGHEFITLDRDRARAEALHGDTVARCVDWHAATEGALDFGLIDTVVHLGSARPHHGASLLADSVAKMFWLFSRIAEAGVARVIYASSQSIYGGAQPSPWVEALAPAPESAYAQAKFAGETMLESLSHLYPGLQWTALRLATLTGPESEIGQHEALSKIVRSVCRGDQVVLQSAAHRLSRLEAGDAAAAVARVLECDHVANECFNVGTDESMGLADITDEALGLFRAKGRSPSGTVQVQNAPESVCRQMSWKKFQAVYGWTPKVTMRSVIKQIVDEEQYPIATE